MRIALGPTRLVVVKGDEAVEGDLLRRVGRWPNARCLTNHDVPVGDRNAALGALARPTPAP